MEKNNEPKLSGVLYSQVDFIWMEVRDLIKKALGYSDQAYALQDILEGIKTRDLQLWTASRGQKTTTIMVTKIINYPQKKSLLIMLYAGESLKLMIQFKPVIYAWAKENGCCEVQIYGRMGWEKMLGNEGYEKIYTVLRAKI